jgi:DNA-directed RNA polymerase beta subunit
MTTVDTTGNSTSNTINDSISKSEGTGTESTKNIKTSSLAVNNDDLVGSMMRVIINAVINQEGLVSHNIDGFNELINGGISKIITTMFKIDAPVKNDRVQTEADKKIKSYRIQFEFYNVEIGCPIHTVYETGKFTILTPGRSRMSNIPYSGSITMSAKIRLTAIYEGRSSEKHVDIPTFNIGNFPIMVGSSRCNIGTASRETKKMLQEDPNDPGGYFIIGNGIEQVVEPLENIKYNCGLYHIKSEPNELVRTEFISQAGGSFEQSSQFRLRYMVNGQITVEFTSQKYKKLKMPFYIIYRLFGMTSDRQICETIAGDLSQQTAVTTRVCNILEKALQLSDDMFAPLINELDCTKIATYTAEMIFKYIPTGSAYATNEAAVQYVIADLLGTNDRKGLDELLLPHIGKTIEARIQKLRFFGNLIKKMLLVHLGVLLPIDRDSLRTKDIHGAAISIAKSIKTHFNDNIATPMIKNLRIILKNNPWDLITESTIRDAVKSAISSSEFDKAMERAVSAGNKTIIIKHKMSMNRISSEALERKNPTNVIQSLRNIVTQSAKSSSNQTDRAFKMRGVHNTYNGYICPSQSPDSGEAVGKKKQIAITAGICMAGSPATLIALINQDPDIIPLDSVPIGKEEGLSNIMIDGKWIGMCKNPYQICEKYRQHRRNGELEATTTIYCDPITTEIEFQFNAGRMKRPILIVYNNINEYDVAARSGNKIEFKQWVRFTKAHFYQILSGELTLNKMIEQGIMEIITSPEHENCYVCPFIDQFLKDKNDITKQYSHLDVEEATMGLMALMSPYGNYTQAARLTFETAQLKQTAMWYSMNWPFRADKNRFFQFYNEMPIIRTMTSQITMGGGLNVVIAYMSMLGDNQEDSGIVNKSASDRGLFDGLFTRYEESELGKDEQFVKPDKTITKGVKPGSNYDKLVDGIIKVGSTVKYGDVLIGKIAKISKQSEKSQYKFVDKSVIYRYKEEAFVDETIMQRDSKDEIVVVVKMKYSRPLTVGSKMSTRSGNKMITAVTYAQSDMPFTESGMVPDIIYNSHSLPTRMTVGQMKETSSSRVAIKHGRIEDGTMFMPLDHEQDMLDLVNIGLRFNGKERMYDGFTGNWLDVSIFIGFVAQQRLLKFASDEEQCAGGIVPTDQRTGQPVGGKAVEGALKIGEMEKWAKEAQGAMFTSMEKGSIDSDGRRNYICRGCCEPAIYNQQSEIYKCLNCGDLADIQAIDSSKCATLLHDELAAGNIQMKYAPRPREFDV